MNQYGRLSRILLSRHKRNRRKSKTTDSRVTTVKMGRNLSAIPMSTETTDSTPRGFLLRANKRKKITTVSQETAKAEDHVKALKDAYSDALKTHFVGTTNFESENLSSRVARLERAARVPLTHCCAYYNGLQDQFLYPPGSGVSTAIVPGTTRGISLSDVVLRDHITKFNTEPNNLPNVGDKKFTSLYIHKLHVRGWPFGLPSIQGCIMSIVKDKENTEVENNRIFTDNTWTLGVGDNDNGNGCFFDPSQYEVISDVMALSREPVFQGVDQIITFKTPHKVTYQTERFFSGIGGVEEFITAGQLYFVIRNCRPDVANSVINHTTSIRIWYEI